MLSLSKIFMSEIKETLIGLEMSLDEDNLEACRAAGELRGNLDMLGAYMDKLEEKLKEQEKGRNE